MNCTNLEVSHDDCLCNIAILLSVRSAARNIQHGEGGFVLVALQDPAVNHPNRVKGEFCCFPFDHATMLYK